MMAAPAAASPPERFEEPFTPNFPDLENDLAVFVNIDRDSYCTEEVVAFEVAIVAWIAGGMMDPFPEERGHGHTEAEEWTINSREGLSGWQSP